MTYEKFLTGFSYIVSYAHCLQVSAQDLDRGDNKLVEYSLETSRVSDPLKIDKTTGLITVELPDEIVRKRGSDPYIQVSFFSGDKSIGTLGFHI